MGKINNEHDSQNNSTFMQDDLDTSFEIKESLFDKIKSALTRPRLGPGNNVKTTNMSFNSWSIRATFRKALEAVSNGMSNIMRKKEPEIKNGFSTIVIGNDEKTKSKDLNINEKETVQAPNIFIPGKIPGLKTTAKVSTTPDLLVGNAHAQKSSEKPEELKVESLTVDEENLLKEEDKTKTSQAQNKEVNKSSLKPETINVGNKTQEKQTEEDRSI